MEDIILLERCPLCKKRLKLRESCRGNDSSQDTYLVQYCTCAEYPLKELCKTLPIPTTSKIVPIKKSNKLKKLLQEEE